MCIRDRIISPSSESVELYSVLDERIKILGDEPSYIGDAHAHPVGVSWMSQVPSPDDIASVSVLADLWPADSEELIHRAPILQVVVSLLFGDYILIERASERTTFGSVEDQSKQLAEIADAYAAAHEAENNRVGLLPDSITHDAAVRTLSKILERLTPTLQGRATLRLLANDDALDVWSRAD